jgi:tetratricopeptide (TPR) repeat protein
MDKRLLLALVVAASALSGCSRSAQHYFESGNKYFDKKEYKSAIVQYRSAIAKNARYGEARAKLADSYMAIGDAANAMREYVRAADIQTKDAEIQVKAASILILAGRYEDAKARADKALEADPKNVPAQVARANALAGMKDLDGAIAEIDEAIKLDATRAPTYSNLGYLQLVKGNPEEAEAAFRKAVTTDPKSVPAHLALANFLWSTARHEDAEAELKAALGIDRANVPANRALAMLYMTSGRGAEAEGPLKVLANATADGGAKLTLADYYVGANRVPEGVALLNQLAQVDATFAVAKLRLASIAYGEKKPAEAYKIVDEVLARQPKNALAMTVQGSFLASEGKIDEALAKATAAAAADPRLIQAHFLVGRLQESRKNFDEAITAFNEVIKLAPRAAGAKQELVKLYLAKNDPSVAVQLAEQLNKERPGPDSRLLLARALTAHNDVDKAHETLAALSKQYPSAAVVQVQLGALAARKNDAAGAERAFQEAARLDPRSREALLGLVAIDISKRNPRQAQQRIEAHLAKNGDDPAVMTLLARTMMMNGESARAEETLKKVVQAAPASLDAYGLLGQLYLSQRRLGEALAEFDRIAAHQPKGVGAQTLAAMIVQLQNQPDEAMKRYEKILQIDGHAAVAANNLAWMYAEKGDKLDVALQLAQTAKAQLPDAPQVNDTLGWVYYKKGLPALAVAPLRESVEKDPKNPLFHYHLGVVYAGAGDAEKARQSLEQALSLKADFEGSADARKVLASLKG